MMRCVSYPCFIISLNQCWTTHDGGILSHRLFVLFKIAFQHILFFLHFFLYLFVEVLVFFVETLSYFLIVSHN
jgi:hypothetical protein